MGSEINSANLHGLGFTPAVKGSGEESASVQSEASVFLKTGQNQKPVFPEDVPVFPKAAADQDAERNNLPSTAEMKARIESGLQRMSLPHKIDIDPVKFSAVCGLPGLMLLLMQIVEALQKLQASIRDAGAKSTTVQNEASVAQAHSTAATGVSALCGSLVGGVMNTACSVASFRAGKQEAGLISDKANSADPEMVTMLDGQIAELNNKGDLYKSLGGTFAELSTSGSRVGTAAQEGSAIQSGAASNTAQATTTTFQDSLNHTLQLLTKFLDLIKELLESKNAVVGGIAGTKV